MGKIEEIAGVAGVDGIFIGPSDLAADMGHLGQPGALAVQKVVEAGIARIIDSGKPAGILTGDLALAQRYLDMGATFVAVGNDVSLLMQSARALRARFGGGAGGAGSGY